MKHILSNSDFDIPSSSASVLSAALSAAFINAFSAIVLESYIVMSIHAPCGVLLITNKPADTVRSGPLSHDHLLPRTTCHGMSGLRSSHTTAFDVAISICRQRSAGIGLTPVNH